jgi:hypothetical protein
LRGATFLQSTTDARGRFAIANVPNGRFFIHVTPGLNDTEHLPGGDQSRRSYSAEQLRGQSMTIKVSSSPSPRPGTPAARAASLAIRTSSTGSRQHTNSDGPCRELRAACRIRGTATTNALESFPEVADYTRGTRLELGDYDAARGDDKFKLRAFGDARLPIEVTYADVYLWKNARDNKYFITMVNRVNAQDPNSPAHLEIKLLYGGAVHDQRYIVSVPPGLGSRQGWFTVLRYNMTGRDNRLHRATRVARLQVLHVVVGGADKRHGTSDDVLTAPPVNTMPCRPCARLSFDGWERYQDKATGQYLVRAVNDPGGDTNIDDDPELDEINVGCESCHGPGSEHVANGGRSRFIVNPRYLSAERSSVVCGRCHDRRQGYGGPTVGYTQAISEAGQLAPPGISRHELISKYTDKGRRCGTAGGQHLADVHATSSAARFLKSKM